MFQLRFFNKNVQHIKGFNTFKPQRRGGGLFRRNNIKWEEPASNCNEDGDWAILQSAKIPQDIVCFGAHNVIDTGQLQDFVVCQPFRVWCDRRILRLWDPVPNVIDATPIVTPILGDAFGWLYGPGLGQSYCFLHLAMHVICMYIMRNSWSFYIQ